jgi:hypothetical protein
MRRLSIFVGLALGLCLPFALRGADEKKMTVVDYYLRLPDRLSKDLRQTGCVFLSNQNAE